MFLCLLIICLGGSAVMGSVYLITYEPIAAAQAAKVNQAIARVLPEFDNVPALEAYQVLVDGRQVTVYPAQKDGVFAGAAIEAVTTRGFGGPIKVMVGFRPDGTIHNTAVISHTETPGLEIRWIPGKAISVCSSREKIPGRSALR